MIFYHFTNDMRFKSIKENLVAVANHLKYGNWNHPSQSLAQAKNGWYPVYLFYFGLYKGAHNVDLILTGKWNYVLGEFIKKLQFPNPKADKQNYYELEVQNQQQIAPLRILVKLLFYSYEFKDNVGITKQEFKNYILGSDSTAIQGISIGDLHDAIKSTPNVDFFNTNVNVSGGDSNRFTNQLLGVIEPLDYIEIDSDTIRLSFTDITTEDKAILFDIITYDEYWIVDTTLSRQDLEMSYKEYIQSPELVDWSGEEIEEYGTDEYDFVDRAEVGMNTLLYGVPGAGKSYTIEHEYMQKDSPRERLVFHPDYTYSDFVGQILPVVNEDKNGNKNVNYRFTPGPFTTILKDAYTNPMVEHFLIIEEINRGNAPAIFGEIFQLLDRKTEIDLSNDDGFPLHTSEYEISNTDVAEYVYGDKRHKIRIPANLSIIGTMNTSDQNVFTLDTAFQRRWDMRLIENEFKSDDDGLANTKILDTSVTWKKFCTSINDIILDKNVRMTSSEDKRLGTHFIHISDLQPTGTDERHKRLFPEKVIKYLWDDAFKFTREEIFDVAKFNSLEKVIRTFIDSKNDDKFNIFSASLKDILLDNKVTPGTQD
ncbi:McrB family protein [Enterococcus hermanniensis]|uniref:ATPase dynein-related AAA domain-containing protein n=1 Tax=Enterococcus hermanniensis TaxID=249189 RepID=A0A1L8TPQ5_9ENTE|nr:AAA family ATPase [Enterococcus hermanniensis]OJG46315.1 hypothetical protein RV04_GL001481 [Enterococcus hermanniensis]